MGTLLLIVGFAWWFFFGLKGGGESGLQRFVATDWSNYWRGFWRKVRWGFGWIITACLAFAALWFVVRVLHWVWVNPLPLPWD